MTRVKATDRKIAAGCHTCHGTAAHWTGPNAQGLAALHHDRTSHRTWCTIAQSVTYGREEADTRQIDIEDAIKEAARG